MINDDTIDSSEKSELKSTFAKFVENGRNTLDARGRNRLMAAYKKNIDVVDKQLDLLGIESEE